MRMTGLSLEEALSNKKREPNAMILAVVQARMGSKRLPGKAVATLQGQPMILRQLERLRAARRLNKIIVATSHGDRSHALRAIAAGAYDFCEKPIDILDRLPTTESGTSGGKGLLDQLGGSTAPAALGTTAPELPASGETTPVTMPQAASATKPAASSAEQSAAGGTTAPAAPQVPN